LWVPTPPPLVLPLALPPAPLTLFASLRLFVSTLSPSLAPTFVSTTLASKTLVLKTLAPVFVFSSCCLLV